MTDIAKLPILAWTFRVDVTPPVGGYFCGGLHVLPSIGVEQPIYLRGMIFQQGARRWVVASIEYTYLCGVSQDRIVAAIADAAKVPHTCVAVQSVHTHDAPLIDEAAHALYAAAHPGIHDETYFSGVLARSAQAIRDAMSRPGTRLAAIRKASHRVEEFASTRRVIDGENRCHVRFSRCRDPIIRGAAEGKIDPMLDQLIFLDEGHRPFACFQFYACHPQVSDGRRLVSGDTTGVATELFEAANPGVFPIYFTGCAGDVTAGKYTTGRGERDRLAFGVRLFDAMQGGFDSSTPVIPVDSIDWSFDEFAMPLRSEPHGVEHYRAVISDPGRGIGAKYLAARKLVKLEQKLSCYPFRSMCLSLGDARVLLLPSELSIEYQLYAKSLAKGNTFVAAYGDSFLNYVATDEAFAQGGYEVDPDWTEVDRGCEQPIKRAIVRVMGL